MMTTVLIDMAAAGGIETGRLERCLGLTVEPVGPGRYVVTGGDEPHWVDLYSRFLPKCDCGDHLWREQVCKHILAALLREGDERVIREVGGLVHALRALIASHQPPRRRRRKREPSAETAEAGASGDERHLTGAA